MPERKTVLLIPGLFSPRWHMWALRRALERQGFDAQVWDDASVFGALEDSIEKLGRRLGEHDGELRVVTHSFGDWLFRQVAARGGAAKVIALVSLVPVMSASIVPSLLRPLGAVAPEISVMASEAKAAADIELPDEIQRLIVWSKIDPWVRRVATETCPNTRSIAVTGTHNTILWQPGVHRIVVKHLDETRRPA